MERFNAGKLERLMKKNKYVLDLKLVSFMHGTNEWQ